MEDLTGRASCCGGESVSSGPVALTENGARRETKDETTTAPARADATLGRIAYGETAYGESERSACLDDRARVCITNWHSLLMQVTKITGGQRGDQLAGAVAAAAGRLCAVLRSVANPRVRWP